MSSIEVTLIVLWALTIVFAGAAWVRARSARDAVGQAAKERAALLAGQRGLEQRLQVAQMQLDALGEAALDGLLLLDEDRRVVWGNSGAWEILQARGGSTGQSFIALVHDVELNQAVVDAQSGHRPIVRQAAVDGRTLRIRAVPLKDVPGVAVAIEDVTELQRLGRARRDLVANISHELRTPLANIDLAAQTLRGAAIDDGELRQKMLDQIDSYVGTLSLLSEEMMDLAQIESGQVLLKLVPTGMVPLVEHALQLLRPQANVKQQALNLSVPEEMIVLADEQQVTRVISNLVSNAIKFAPEGGTIQITAEDAGPEDVQVCVIDNGPGIPEAEQERIFERFYKADRARSRGGTGLGLAIARHIVEGHGGQIWVESVPGQGAKFCFTLPKA